MQSSKKSKLAISRWTLAIRHERRTKGQQLKANSSSNSQRPKANSLVIFDLDGTIVDSLKSNYGLFRQILRKHKLKTPSINQFRAMFETNFYKSLKKKIPTRLYKPLFEEFRKLYNQKYNAKAFPGMAKLVNSLQKTAVLSSNFKKGIIRALKSNKIKVNMIIGADKETNKTKKIKQCIKKLRPSKTILVTDSIGDIKEAKKARIKTIGVTWGYSKNIKKARPNYTIHTVRELTKCLKTITKY